MQQIQLTKQQYKLLVRVDVPFVYDSSEIFFKKIMAISGLFPRDLRNIFGKASKFYSNGNSLWSLHVWAFRFKETIFTISSANERGTTIESETILDEKSVEEFYNALIEKVKNVESTKVWLVNS